MWSCVQVVGAYAEDLGIEDEELRIKAVKLLGAIFLVGSYHGDFSQAFAEFKRRSVDKDPDVRKALVNVMHALVTKRQEMGKILMHDDWNYMGASREAPLLTLVIDPDEGVRREAVAAVLSSCLVNADAVPQGIIEVVAERVLDKKPSVRKQAMEGLAMLWQKYCGPFSAERLPKNVSDRFGWIPSKLLGIPVTESSLRNTVLHCVEDICPSPLNDVRSSAEVVLKKCLSLIPVLASFNPNIVLDEEKLLEDLLTARCNDTGVCESVLKTIAVAGKSMTSLCKSKTVIGTIKELCSHDSWVVAKYAMRAVVALGYDNRNTLIKVAEEAAGHASSFSKKLPSSLRVLCEVARVCPEALAKDREAVSKFVHKRLLQGAWPASAGKKDRIVVIDSKIQGLKLLTMLSLHEDEATTVLELCEEIIANQGEIQSGENATSKNDKVTLRKTAGLCILKIAKEAGAQSRVSPAIFATLSRLFEDEERAVKDAMMKKVHKGTAVQQGKLPFRFVSLLAMVMHDTDSGLVDRGKNFLRHTLLVMSRLRKQTGSEVASIMPESVFSWLVYLLVVHHEYADPDEDATQASVAFKKYFEAFFISVPTEDQNSQSMQQLLEYIQKCSVPSAAAAQGTPKIIDRNKGLASDVALKLLQHKRWASKGGFSATSSASKIVDASIFCPKGKGEETTSALAVSPVKAASGKSKAASKKDAKASKTSSVFEMDSPAKSPIKSRRSEADSQGQEDLHMKDEDVHMDDDEVASGKSKVKAASGKSKAASKKGKTSSVSDMVAPAKSPIKSRRSEAESQGQEDLHMKDEDIHMDDDEAASGKSKVKAAGGKSKVASKKGAKASKTSSVFEMDSPATSPIKSRRSEADSQGHEDVTMKDEDVHMDADDGAEAFDFDSSEQPKEHGRRSHSIGHAPSSGKKVLCPCASACLAAPFLSMINLQAGLCCGHADVCFRHADMCWFWFAG